MPSGDPPSVAANAGERDVRPEWPLVRLAKGLEE
jgi:hypothetical protein